MSRYVVSLLGMLVVGAVALPAQQVGQNMQVKVAKVRMHTAASVDSAKVRDLTKGTVVTVVATQDNWVKVKLADQKTMGWIRDDMLDAAPAMAGAATSAASTSSSMPADAAPPPPPAPMAPPPPPPVQRTMAPPPPPKPSAPMHTKMSSSSQGQHGGLVLFGGLTEFKTKDTFSGQSETSGTASGFMGGLGGLAPIGGHFGIEIDAAYLQTGFASPSGVTPKESEHTNTASGSFLLRPVFGNGTAKLFLLGGGYARVAINCKYSDASDGACKITSAVNRFGYGAELGAGVMFGRLAVQGRYDIGLANLSNTSGETVKSSGFMVMAGFVL